MRPNVARMRPRSRAFLAGTGPGSRLGPEAPGETAIRVGGAPFPGPLTAVIVEDGHLVRVTEAVVAQGRRAGQRSEGVVCSRRCSIRCGSRSRTLPPGALESGSTFAKFPPLPSRIRGFRAVEEVAPDVTSIFGGRL